MKIFYYEFIVGEDAIDVNHHANNAHYVIWMQEAANAHSNAVGDLIETNLAQNRTLEEMTQNALWHLQIANFAHDENAVRSRLESIAKDGLVTEKIISSMKLLVF